MGRKVNRHFTQSKKKLFSFEHYTPGIKRLLLVIYLFIFNHIRYIRKPGDGNTGSGNEGLPVMMAVE